MPFANVVKLADTPDSGSGEAIHAGSSPGVRTIYRGIAQLVARLSGGQEVMSSSLGTPTKKKSRASGFFFLYSSLFAFHS